MEEVSSQSQETEVTSDDGSPTRAAARGLRTRKQVVYNEKVMAKRASTDSDDDDEKDDGKNDDDDGFDDDVDDEARRLPLELWTDGETDGRTSAATDGGESSSGVAGHELFGFKQMKRKDALTKTVSYSTSAAQKEREAAEEGLSTPKKREKEDRKVGVLFVCLLYLFVHSLDHFHSQARSLIHSVFPSFIHSFIHLFIHSFIPSFIHSLIH